MIDNEERAAHANQALATFIEATGIQDEPLDTQISDLLCNLGHLCVQNDIDFDSLVNKSLILLSTEIAEDSDLTDQVGS